MAEVIDILGQLRKDSIRIDKAATALYEKSQELEGGIDKAGQVVRGVRWEYEKAWDDELIAFEERYLSRDQRLPAQDVRNARVRRAVEKDNPELCERFHALEATVAQLQRLISSRKSAVSANQSILKGEAA